MPPLEDAEFTEIITYYAYIGTDEFGHIKTQPGIEINAHWVHRNQQVIEPDASVINIVAGVAVDRRLKPGSLLWRGRLVDYEDGTGTADAELVQVRLMDDVPDVQGRETRYAVRCTRHLQKFDIVT